MFGEYLRFASAVPARSLLYHGHYAVPIVILSIAIAIFSAYSAFVMARLAEPLPRRALRNGLLSLSGLAMGIGIWAMHFIGILGFDLPCGVAYDAAITGASMLPGIAASVFAMHVVSRPGPGFPTLLAGGTLLGLGIGGMHYSGMAAMRFDGYLLYDPLLFAVSIVAAIVLAIAALHYRASRGAARGWRALLGPAAVLGLATSAMHYTAMTAAYFVRTPALDVVGRGMDPHFVALTVSTVIVAATFATLVLVLREAARERGHAEQLAETEAWYRGIIESAPDGMAVVDAAGTMVLTNPRLDAMFGYAHGELANRPLAILLPAGSGGDDAALLGRLEAGLALYGRRRDGGEFPIEVSVGRLPARGHYGVCVCATVRDVSARTAIETELEIQRKRLESIFFGAPVGIGIMVGGVCRYANPKLVELVDVAVGRRDDSLFVDPGERRRMLVELDREGAAPARAYRCYGPDGRPREVLAAFSSLAYEGERGMLVWLIDPGMAGQAQTPAVGAR